MIPALALRYAVARGFRRLPVYRAAIIIAASGLLTVLPTARAFAQTSTISGAVRDELGAPMSGMRVVLTTTQISSVALQTTVTNMSGAYTFTTPVGGFFVVVQARGSDVTRRQQVQTQANTVQTADFTVVVRVLPQFVMGGSWSTTIVNNNVLPELTDALIEFYTDEGLPLQATSGTFSGNAISNSLNRAYGSSVLEFASSGTLTQGWARIYLPQGVGGYGLFRQAISGRAEQEAVVPFASNLAKTAVLSFDNRARTTAAAIVNPGETPVVVTATLYNSFGAALGSGTFSLAPREKVASVLTDLPGLAKAANLDGTVVFGVSSGAISVLGLRFGGEAFTSIPVDHFH